MLKSFNRVLSFFLVLILLFSILPGNLTVYAQEETKNKVLAKWSFDNDTMKLPDQAIDANKSAIIETNATAIDVSTPSGFETPTFGAKGFSDSTVGQNGFITSVSTQGYENIRLSSKQRSSNTGPLYFTLQISLDGINWKDVGEQYEVKNNWTTGELNEVSLPAVSNDLDKLHIRWVVSQSGQVSDPSKAISSGGMTYIDDIVINGDVKGSATGEEEDGNGTSLKVTYTANSKSGNYWWSINKDGYVFKHGDYVEYDVFLFNNVPGLGGVEVYTTGSPLTGDFKFREQFKAGEWVDQDGYLGIPSTDISSKAYGKWYHRKLQIPESAVGTTLRDFTIGIDTRGHNPGDMFTAYYDNIAITNNGLVVKEIYTDGEPKVSQKVSPDSNTSYDVEVVPMAEIEGTPEPLPPGTDDQDGDIESISGMYSVLLNVNDDTMKANSSFNTTTYTIKSKPVLVKGIPYVPLIDVMEKIGASVTWDGATQTATIRQAKNVATLKLGSSTFTLNGAVKALDEADSQLRSFAGDDASLMVPASLIRNFGATVNYFPISGNIKIVTPIISVNYRSPYPTQEVIPNQVDPNDIAHRFVISADSQGVDNGLLNGTDDGTGPKFEAVLSQIKSLELQPDYIIGAGDLVSGSMSRNVDEQNEQLDNFRKRFEKYFSIDKLLPIPGNHEIKGSSDLEASFAAKFPEFTSRQDVVFLEGYNNSVWYYDVGDTRIFGLNTSHPKEEHAIINKQYDFVKSNMDSSKKRTIFVFHEPAFSIWKSGNAQERNRVARNELWKLIESAPNPIVFVGHEHLYARTLINNKFNETINGKAYNFDKQIYQIHIGGFGGNTNGTSNEYKGVVTYPEAMGVNHFAVVDLLTDGRIHVQAISHDGVLLDDFIQSADDVNTTYSNTMKLDKNAVVIQPSDTHTLTATLASNTSDKAKTIQWSSSDESIATVDKNGKVTAVGHGEAFIVATAEGGMFAASKVTVLQAGVQDPDYVPQQLTMHVGTDASTSVNFAWTTNEPTNTVLTVNKKGESQPTTFNGTNALGAGSRYFHKVEVKGLTPGTAYEYTAGEGVHTLTGTFKTAPAAGNKDGFTFTYIVDPQISNAVNAIAAGATFNELNKISDSAFTFIGGDLTDSNSNETQWRLFFNNGGAYPTAGADFLKDNVISVVQGNHDNATFNGHINVPNQAGGAYAFDYGPAKFVMLNSQNASLEEKQAQEALLRSEVAKAKENGQWTFVGMHKAIYTGASHITDADIIDLRKYWSPIYAELDIDVVLQGHDHVFSRGFVNAEGAKANRKMLDETVALKPDNAPFYITALQAGGLKWYSNKNYTVSPGDPLTPDYEFLDLNSAKPVGHPLNPKGSQSDIAKETAYVTVSLTPNSLTFNTYAFKYDQNINQITKQPYLYDTYTIKKTAAAEDQAAPTNLSGVVPTTSENKDGKIVGTTIGMEYKLSTETNWTAITETEITGLVPGTYNVRYAAKEGYNAGAEAIVIVSEYKAYTVTFKTGSGGKITVGNSGSYAPGTTINIEASANSSYKFNGWTVDGEGTFANAKSASTTFTMPAANVTITAHFTYGGTTTPTTPTPAEISTTKDGDITVVSALVNAQRDNVTGTANAKIGVDTVTSLVNQAKEDEASGQKTVLEIKVKSTEGMTAVDVEIPRDPFERVTDYTNASLKVDAGIATITFDQKAVASINSSASAEDITISIKEVENAALTEEARSKVGDRKVYDFLVKSGDAQITNFNGGKIEITLPYTPKVGEKENSIVAYYIDNAGKIVPVRGKYDSASKMLKFTTSHLSYYAVGYNEVNFSDVAAHAWYDKAIGFMSARGMIKGVGGGRFKPENNVTRADFLIMVMNSYGIEPDKNTTNNFSDSGNKYYTKYLGTAKRLGLVSGVGNNRYVPKAPISRQDMFVILYNALDQLDELPVDTNGKSLESFRDAHDISVYAKDALKLFVANEIVKGDGKNLTPKATATRGQAAQILYNLLSK